MKFQINLIFFQNKFGRFKNLTYLCTQKIKRKLNNKNKNNYEAEFG